MKAEQGTVFLLLILAGGGVWFWTRAKRRGIIAAPDSAVTVMAGTDTPVLGLSNSPFIYADDWDVPYYLRSNYPMNRGGNEVMPSVVMGDLPSWFGAQQIPPQM